MRMAVHLPYLALLAVALQGVGVCCDDYPMIVLRNADPPVEQWQATPVLIATHGLAYEALGYGSFWLYDALKIGWMLLAYALVYRFATLWFDAARAALFAALFLLFPTHDSTVFWFSNQYLTLTAAFYLYAYSLAERGRLPGAVVMAGLGSFVSYGSPPWAIGLAIAFALQRRLKPALALLLPQIAYAGYYLFLTERLGVGSKRLPEAWDVTAFAKQLALQVLGGLEAVLGPSIVLKVWWSVASLGLASLAAGGVIWLLAARHSGQAPAARLPLPLWIGALAVAATGFAMFAATGFYPQSAFGLGNRVTIYASFAVALAVAALPMARWVRSLLLAVLFATTLGLADHWRAWRGTQSRTIAAIRAHPELAPQRFPEATLFVTGADYSRLGPLAHIAFLTEPWTTDAVFTLALGLKRFEAVPLSARFRVTPEGLVDPKHGERYPIGEHITVYDADRDSLRRVARGDVAAFVAGIEAPPRHWIQLAGFDWAGELIAAWMPRLAYLFAR